MSFDQALLAIHVLAVTIWVGALASLTLVLSAPSSLGDSKVRGALGRRIYTNAAVPAFIVAFTAGIIRLLKYWQALYAHQHWMHGKLTAALVLIAVHHVLGARARKMADAGADVGPAVVLGAVAMLAAAVAVAMVILRP